MLRKLLLPLIVFWVGATAVQAQQVTSERVDALIKAMRIPDLLDIVRQEGINDAPQLAETMFAKQAGPDWTREVEQIYRPSRNLNLVNRRIGGILSRNEIEQNIAFFGSELGQKVLVREIESRRALLDINVERQVRAVSDQLRASNDPRLDAFRPLIRAYDLVDANVVAAMNSNIAFFEGMLDGGALPDGMTGDDILDEVWSTSDAIREETEGWLFGYLLLAYGKLSRDEMEAYVAFAETDAAQALNQAMFEAFDDLFGRINRDLGYAVAQRMQQEEI